MAPPDRRAHAPFPEAASELVSRDGRPLRELAPIVEMSHPYLFRLLRGERPASIEQMERIAEALGVPGSYFLEVRLARINEYLRRHQRTREQIWDQLRLRRD